METHPVVGTVPAQCLEMPSLCPHPNILSVMRALNIQSEDFLFASETS